MNNLFTPQQIQLDDMVFISAADKALLGGTLAINTQDAELDRIFDEVANEIALAFDFIGSVQKQFLSGQDNLVWQQSHQSELKVDNSMKRYAVTQLKLRKIAALKHLATGVALVSAVSNKFNLNRDEESALGDIGLGSILSFNNSFPM